MDLPWEQFGLAGLILAGVWTLGWRFASVFREFLVGKNGNGGYLKTFQDDKESSRKISESLDRTTQGIKVSIDVHEKRSAERIASASREFEAISRTHEYCIRVHGGIIEAGKHACDVMEVVCIQLDVPQEEVAPAFAKIREALGAGSVPPTPICDLRKTPPK